MPTETIKIDKVIAFHRSYALALPIATRETAKKPAMGSTNENTASIRKMGTAPSQPEPRNNWTIQSAKTAMVSVTNMVPSTNLPIIDVIVLRSRLGSLATRARVGYSTFMTGGSIWLEGMDVSMLARLNNPSDCAPPM